MSRSIKRFLQQAYPALNDCLERTATIPRIRRRVDFVLPEAFVRVVVGQMLSGKAADTIYGRVRTAAIEQNLPGSWLLDLDSLRKCGLSGAKAAAVLNLRSRIGTVPTALDHWYDLSPNDLVDEIKTYRGMGAWSASILALFYVGHEDIFPTGDGSLDRAMRLIRESSENYVVDPTLAAPYRSYLALYLWQCLDTGILRRTLR
jgi:DNA-3-methyladenine glycosylase II